MVYTVYIVTVGFWNNPNEKEIDLAKDHMCLKHKFVSSVYMGVPTHVASKFGPHPSVIFLSYFEYYGLRRAYPISGDRYILQKSHEINDKLNDFCFTFTRTQTSLQSSNF